VGRGVFVSHQNGPVRALHLLNDRDLSRSLLNPDRLLEWKLRLPSVHHDWLEMRYPPLPAALARTLRRATGYPAFLVQQR
jgi:hypothetical protein